MTTSETAHGIDATATSMAVLEHVVEADGHVGVSAVARDLGISKSMAYNHLLTLRNLELVVKRERKYAPSMGLLTLGERTREGIEVFDHGQSAVENLADATGEVAGVFIMEEHYGVAADIQRGTTEWEPPYTVGERLPLHVNAQGKAILASLPADQATTILEESDREKPADETVMGTVDPEREVKKARENGELFCRSEQYPNVVGVAAPIAVVESRYHASLAIVGPVDRLHGRYLEEDLVGQVVSTAKEIEISLTG